MVATGETLCPEEPGALGMAAWRVGRRWRRAGEPLCSGCPIAGACLQLVEQAAGVAAAGTAAPARRRRAHV